MVSSKVCVAENLTVDDATGLLQMAKCSVPRVVHDYLAHSAGDGQLLATTTLPGKLLIEHKFSWKNDSPVDQTMLIRVTRRWRETLVSNPNAIEYRDRWSWAINTDPVEPVVSGLYNGQTGLSGDIGTNTVAEPNPGLWYGWYPTTSTDEWIGLPLTPGDKLTVWYRHYVWTPRPWSDNANKNQPHHSAAAGWARLQLWAFPQQGPLVIG